MQAARQSLLRFLKMNQRIVRSKQIHTNSLEIKMAQLYCILLPFRMIFQLSFLKSVFGVCANYLPFIFHLLGLFIWMANERGRIDLSTKRGLMGEAGRLVLYLNLSSLVMAFVIQMKYGNHGGENAFLGILGMEIYFFQYFFMFLYNYRVFRILTVATINKTLHASCLSLLFIGYFQVLVMNGIGGSIYDGLNFLGVLNSSDNLPKLCLTGVEGATAGCIIGVFVMPFLLSKVLNEERKYFFEILLWIVPILYTNSSTAYLLFVTDWIVFFIILLTKSKNPRKIIRIFLITIICIALGLCALFLLGVIDESVLDAVYYNLFIKPVSFDSNGSTTSRTIPFYVNWGAFTEYPIIGTGNGLQGYFYERYFPSWAVNVAGSDVGVFLENSRNGISNGGVFIPSLLSGYGIIGMALIAHFVYRCIKENSNNKMYDDNMHDLYVISGIAFVVMGFQGDAYGLYFAWFMLSIPFLVRREKK